MRRSLEEVRERPEDFVAQPLIALSTVPTAIDAGLVPLGAAMRASCRRRACPATHYCGARV